MRSKASIKNINLPDAPVTATKTVHDPRYYGEGRKTYEHRHLIPTWDQGETKKRASAARAIRMGIAEKRHDKVMRLADLGASYREIAEETGYAEETVRKIVCKRRKEQACKKQ